MNGLKIQWGTPSDKPYTVTFPVAFSNTSYTVIAKPITPSSGDNDISSVVYKKTTTSFSFSSGGSAYGNTYSFNWLAIGY